MDRTWRAAILALALAGCGGDGGGSSATVKNDGEAGSGKTTQCQAGDQVVATFSVDAPGDAFLGFHTRIRYPGVLALPGHADAPSVAARVRFVHDFPLVPIVPPDESLFVNGSTVVNDEDTDLDGVDDRIQALMISSTPITDGKFVDITFDCVETIAWPTSDAFACEVAGVSDLDTNELSPNSSCQVVVQPPA